MPHPAETAPKAPAAFGSTRLTPEEADRLASTIRPSWDLDDAPFTGPGSLSPDAVQALQGGGTLPDVRAAANEVPSRSQASNGSYPPPPARLSPEPESSVILEDGLAAEIAPAEPQPVPMTRPESTLTGMPAARVAAVADDVLSPSAQAESLPRPLQRPLTPQRPVAPAFQFAPTGSFQPKPAALDLDESYPRKSKTTVWVALGLGAVAVVGLVAWIASSSGSSDPTPAAAATTTAANDKTSTVPPPPAITAAAAVPPAIEPPAPPPAAPPPMAPVPVDALPQVAPAPTHVAAAAAPRANYGGPNQVLRPPGKPKNGPTIMRDVPF
jgi:hypothetical protein